METLFGIADILYIDWQWLSLPYLEMPRVEWTFHM